MGLQSAQILFDNQSGTYNTGDTVTGKVNINLDSPKKIRGVKIKFTGKCYVDWMSEETHTNNEGKQERETVHLSGEETYFVIDYYLIGGQGTELVLPVGQHEYPFTCVLPPTLPSSFEGEYGYVRYTVKVVLDRPWKFDQEIKSAFTVISNVDLNVNNELKKPVTLNLEKYFCCCWCKSGPLTCVISLPFTGFVPGQTVPIIAEVDNISNVEIESVEFAFRKREIYHTKTPRHETKDTVIVLERTSVGPIAAHDSKTYKQPVIIPSIPPSNLTNCSLIDLDYELYFEVHVSGFHSNLTGKIPIVIGTIPINAESMNIQSNNVAIDMAGGNQRPLIGWATNIHPISPPTYAEGQFRAKSIEDSGDNQYTMFAAREFAPKYPVYSFAPSAPAME